MIVFFNGKVEGWEVIDRAESLYANVVNEYIPVDDVTGVDPEEEIFNAAKARTIHIDERTIESLQDMSDYMNSLPTENKYHVGSTNSVKGIKENQDILIEAGGREGEVQYFETKFNRHVYLDEFEVAVIPSNTPKSLVKALMDNGLIIREYRANSEKDRARVVREAVQDNDLDFQIQSKGDGKKGGKGKGNRRRANAGSMINYIEKGIKLTKKAARGLSEAALAKLHSVENSKTLEENGTVSDYVLYGGDYYLCTTDESQFIQVRRHLTSEEYARLQESSNQFPEEHSDGVENRNSDEPSDTGTEGVRNSNAEENQGQSESTEEQGEDVSSDDGGAGGGTENPEGGTDDGGGNDTEQGRSADIQNRKRRGKRLTEITDKVLGVSQKLYAEVINAYTYLSSSMNTLDNWRKKLGLPPIESRLNLSHLASTLKSRADGLRELFIQKTKFVETAHNAIVSLSANAQNAKELLDLYLVCKDYLERVEMGIYKNDKYIRHWRENVSRILKENAKAFGLPENGFVKDAETLCHYVESYLDIMNRDNGNLPSTEQLWESLRSTSRELIQMMEDTKRVGKYRADEMRKRKFYVPQRNSAMEMSEYDMMIPFFFTIFAGSVGTLDIVVEVPCARRPTPPEVESTSPCFALSLKVVFFFRPTRYIF